MFTADIPLRTVSGSFILEKVLLVDLMQCTAAFSLQDDKTAVESPRASFALSEGDKKYLEVMLRVVQAAIESSPSTGLKASPQLVSPVPL